MKILKLTKLTQINRKLHDAPGCDVCDGTPWSRARGTRVMLLVYGAVLGQWSEKSCLIKWCWRRDMQKVREEALQISGEEQIRGRELQVKRPWNGSRLSMFEEQQGGQYIWREWASQRMVWGLTGDQTHEDLERNYVSISVEMGSREGF